MLDIVEGFFLYNRLHIETEIQRRLGGTKARDPVRSLEINVARLALSKSLTKDFPAKALGKLNKEKMQLMRMDW